jgi:hypothetical protein
MTVLHSIHRTAETILDQSPDPAVRVRLLRDVLARPEDSPELQAAREGLQRSRWVRGLAREQQEDGSWGRLHSRGSRVRQRIPTTEWGVARGLALGLHPAHPVLQKAARHLASILDGTVGCSDPPERNDRWPVGVQLFAAATLAQIEPNHLALDDVWSLWAAIASRTFSSGAYDADAEAQAHREWTGASVRDSYLVIGNRYALALLGSRPAQIPGDVEAALARWVWHRPEGMGYLSEPLSQPPPHGKVGRLDRWLWSQEVLSRFSSWRELAQPAARWLWEQRAAGGMWDLGTRPAASTMLPLSENWQKAGARRHDWSTRILVLLRRYAEDGRQINAP